MAVDSFSEAVRARIIELTGNDPGEFVVGGIFPGSDFHKVSVEARVDAIAQSLIRVGKGDCELVGDGEIE